MRHGTEASREMLKPEILTKIPPNTVFYIDSHGGPDQAGRFKFGDCYAQPNSGDEFYIYENEVEDKVGEKTAAQPPYNFVYMDCCYSAYVDSAAVSWGISGYEYDEAYFGWVGESYDSWGYKNYTTAFFQDLADGNTAQHAKEEAERLTEIGGGVGIGDPDTRLYWAYGSSLQF